MNILKKKCPKSGKEITSLYENQLEFNYESHIRSCNKKNEKWRRWGTKENDENY